MLSTLTAVLLAAGVVTPQPTQQLLSPDTGAPRFEAGVLSAPLEGELVGAVRAWALSQRARYGLPANATLRSLEALSTRFGASFHLQQVVDGLDVYQARLVVTLDEQRRVVQVASSLEPSPVARAGESLTTEQALLRAAAALPLVALRPDGVPYGGARAFWFPVGAELHRGWLANVQSLDFSKNWYVAVDAVTGERLFAQNRVHHGSLDAQVYPVSPGGLDAGVGATPTVARTLAHADGGSMIGDTCVLPLLDGGFAEFPNDAGHLCGTQLTSYNCCPTADCVPDAGARRLAGSTSFMGIPVTYDVAVCDRVRRASNVTNGTGDYVYTPVDPPANKTTVLGTDLANSDEFAEVHSFYHVNTVYDWMRRLSQKAAPIYGSQPNILPFQMRDERRSPPVKVAVWSNVMFPNFNELVSGGGACIFNPPCRANTLLRLDNAAFFPREQFSQLPLPGFDTGADTLMIFQGNQADAAYDATVIQHEFGHGAVYATANITFDTVALDQRSANNEGGALHEGFADYIAAAFNNLAEVGPYFGPRATAGQASLPGVTQDTYLRTMDNTFTCPSVLWGEVHQDAQHVAAALWKARQTVFQGTDQGDTFDAAFYAMLVSITPNADFAMTAAAMSARVGTAFPSISTAAAQMTQIFEEKGVINCSKLLDANATNLPRPYFGIASASGTLGSSLVPGPFQFKVAAPQGAARVTVTGVAGGGGGFGGGGSPAVQVLTRKGTPLLFARQGGVLQNNAELTVAMAAGANNTLSGSAQVNAPCNTEVYVALAAAGGGATLQNVNVTVEPLVNCMIPQPDAGTGGGAGGGGGTTDAGAGGGSGGTTTIPSVGPGSTTEQPPAATGCGCTAGVDALALGALALLAARRRRSTR